MPSDQAVIALAALTGLIIAAAAMLRGWRDWLAYKHRELDRQAPEFGPGRSPIELADLRERVRKLEAIASGVDL